MMPRRYVGVKTYVVHDVENRRYELRMEWGDVRIARFISEADVIMWHVGRIDDFLDDQWRRMRIDMDSELALRDAACRPRVEDQRPGESLDEWRSRVWGTGQARLSSEGLRDIVNDTMAAQAIGLNTSRPMWMPQIEFDGMAVPPSVANAAPNSEWNTSGSTLASMRSLMQQYGAFEARPVSGRSATPRTPQRPTAPPKPKVPMATSSEGRFFDVS